MESGIGDPWVAFLIFSTDSIVYCGRVMFPSYGVSSAVSLLLAKNETRRRCEQSTMIFLLVYFVIFKSSITNFDSPYASFDAGLCMKANCKAHLVRTRT